MFPTVLTFCDIIGRDDVLIRQQIRQLSNLGLKNCEDASLLALGCACIEVLDAAASLLLVDG